jgi:hypothetical protein
MRVCGCEEREAGGSKARGYQTRPSCLQGSPPPPPPSCCHGPTTRQLSSCLLLPLPRAASWAPQPAAHRGVQGDEGEGEAEEEGQGDEGDVEGAVGAGGGEEVVQQAADGDAACMRGMEGGG